MKYTKYTLKGEHSADAAHKMLGDAASQGVVVRVDTGGGETNIFVATDDKSPQGKLAADIKSADVSEGDIAKISY